ncbi:MAG: iron ABC transporter permease [archaeon]|nr:iron ABC transporter permease [archaeon]
MKKLGKLSTAGLIAVLFVVLVVVAVVSVFIGAVSIPFDEVIKILVYKIFGIEMGGFGDIKKTHIIIVWELYAPRAIMGLIVGVALALAGVVMQAMVQNPLADPYILGISSGASLGATFAFLMGAGALTGMLANFDVALCAFIGALGASVAVFALASMGSRMTTTKLVLSGTIIASVCGAFSNLIVYLAPSDSGIKSLTFWLMGGLATEGFDNLILPAVILVVCLVFFFTQIRVLNAMLMGDEAATTLGINLATMRKVYILLNAVLISIMVCNCGLIGFVGLIVPHIARAIVGTNHWKLMPIACLIGGIFLVVADIFARSITSSEIPIGIITSIVGTPVFAYIMIKKAYGFGGGD